MLDRDLVQAMRRRYGDLENDSLNTIANEHGVNVSTLSIMVKREGGWERDYIGSQIHILREYVRVIGNELAELEEEYAKLRDRYQEKSKQLRERRKRS